MTTTDMTTTGVLTTTTRRSCTTPCTLVSACACAAAEASTTSAVVWTAVCRLDDLAPMWAEAALVGSSQVAVVRLPDDSIRAFGHLDPLTGSAVMARGIVGSRAGRPTVASPLHKDVYDLETGACLTKPDLRLPIWRSRVVEGTVEVSPARALVGASHGTSDPVGRRAVAALLAGVREAAPELTVVDSFVDVQQPDVPTTVDRLDDDRGAALVPLLLSAGYHVHVDLAEAAADAAPRPVVVTGALGPDDRLAAVLHRRLLEAGWREGDLVVLAAAGSSDARAVADCVTTARALEARLGNPVTAAFISAAEPRVPAAVASARASAPSGTRVVVATYLLAPGYFADLARASGGDLTSAPLLVDDGEAPPPELVEIVLERWRAGA